jgi:TRAP transporter 4TM/12TM fusion protein
MSFTSWVYLVINYDKMIWRIPISTNSVDAVMGLLLVISVLELVRRTQGFGILMLGVGFILYAVLGHLIPIQLLSHTGYSLNRIFGTYYSSYGLYGTIMGITATYIFTFVVFGAMLSATGIGDYFLTLSNYLAGAARGGAAKISVIASSLFGSVSGSAAANAVATGSITIPMMKSKGYDKTFAATVESLASAGGQIAPPIMGAGAFLMAELTGISYPRIILAAIIPAILFYTNTFLAVDLTASKHNYKGLTKDERPKVSEVLSEIYLLLPLVVLVYSLLIANYSIVRVGFLACMACIVVSFINKKNRLNFDKITDLVYSIAKNMVGITAITGVAGIVVATLSLTGLAMNISRILISISGGQVILALIFTMIVTIILGMGMPTTAAYVISASVLAPALQQLGFDALTAHMFIFYYACLSGITPPIAVVSYAAATIAEAPPMKVGWNTVRLGLSIFIIPFLFAFEPSILFEGELHMIAYNFVRCMFGILSITFAMLGRSLNAKLNTRNRVLLFISAGFLLIDMGYVFDAIGFGLTLLNIKLAKVKADKPEASIGN